MARTPTLENPTGIPAARLTHTLCIAYRRSGDLAGVLPTHMATVCVVCRCGSVRVHR